jgi:hypothetical protein
MCMIFLSEYFLFLNIFKFVIWIYLDHKNNILKSLNLLFLKK